MCSGLADQLKRKMLQPGAERDMSRRLLALVSVCVVLVAATYAQVSGCPLNIEWGARAYRSREVMQPWTAFERLPGWRPKVDLASGFARCL